MKQPLKLNWNKQSLLPKKWLHEEQTKKTVWTSKKNIHDKMDAIKNKISDTFILYQIGKIRKQKKQVYMIKKIHFNKSNWNLKPYPVEL